MGKIRQCVLLLIFNVKNEIRFDMSCYTVSPTKLFDIMQQKWFYTQLFFAIVFQGEAVSIDRFYGLSFIAFDSL